MLFNSYIFICLFLPITLIGFFTLAKFRFTLAATTWLLLASLFFYGHWKLAYLFLLLVSIGGNYFIGIAIANKKQGSKQAKLLLWLGIGLNLALIAYYKYAGFIVEEINDILQTNFLTEEIVLPLAISFYTFTQIAYLVDSYRGETKGYNFLQYSLFVTFFPQLIAGPILRHDELIPQLHRRRIFIFNHKHFALGFSLFTLGLAKKMLIADHLSPWVADIFSNVKNLSCIEAWVGALSYTLQLYFDFSGYSDMAIGLGWMFNLNLPVNFNSPYKATSISDFWRRWHITLSNFLRDYLYIPLGGNRKGELRRYFNLIITMLLGGLWHGAGWTFVFWGGLHGVYLAINHQWRSWNWKLPSWFAWAITFIAVLLSWVVFRAKTLADGITFIQAMVGMKGIILPGNWESLLFWLTPLGVEFKGEKLLSALPYLPGNGGLSVALNLATLIALLAGTIALPNTQEIMERFKPTWWWAMLIGGICAYCLLSLNKVSEFLYFQF